ncbi:NAD(P)/FAD-dependent oxidoreductase [Gordonia insulae]|uniref:Gamma-glutamylputrescine oxidoreductase n=1 Tax=Gordonia insulae TaxID=2420509 RepID=A0A3G8JJ13_9ACTN|nr:FAD-binding oxidoreductase [Gordonia insulae]AZG44502.1 Gamma-glutamylputrescine oxidoreductase [Gordonia insulae]
MRNGDVSFWSAAIHAGGTRPSLDGDTDVDFAIVGGGLTGLWTAYYLRREFPDARILVVESRFCGYGASGRNGGWLSAEVPGNRATYAGIAEARGQDGGAANRALTVTMESAVREVASRISDEQIDCDARYSGVLTVARCPAQHDRLLHDVAAATRWGSTGTVLLSQAELLRRVRVADALSASYSPHCIRVQPARLTDGVAAAAERSGIRIVEGTTVTHVEPGRLTTDRGVVRADHIAICVEGFTPALPGRHRALLPMNSSMVVTEPLDHHQWDEIGWEGAELLGESAHAYTYAQRTADGRIALGGRGVPYRYGSRTDDDGRTQPKTAGALIRALQERFPSTRTASIDHTWCGVLGVHRDWCTSITFDERTGIASAAGYVGSGLTTTNVAARTLVDLFAGRDTELTRLPWVGHRSPKWEPEPLRYLGVAGLYAAYRLADRLELRSRAARTNVIATVADRVSGRS